MNLLLTNGELLRLSDRIKEISELLDLDLDDDLHSRLIAELETIQIAVEVSLYNLRRSRLTLVVNNA